MINFGQLKRTASHLLSEAYTGGSGVEAAERHYQAFVRHVQTTPVLRQQYMVYQNLERKGMLREDASAYLERNLAQLSGYSQRELQTAHQGAAHYVPTQSYQASPLLEAIHTLIRENAAPRGKMNVRSFEDARQLVLEALTAPVPVMSTPTDGPPADVDALLEDSAKELDQQCECLSEQEKHILRVLASEDPQEQTRLYEQLLREATDFVEACQGDEHYGQARQRLDEMRRQNADLSQHILDLYELVHGE